MFLRADRTIFEETWNANLFDKSRSMGRKAMGNVIPQNYPNVVPTFDTYKSFVVYDMKQLAGRRHHFVPSLNDNSGLNNIMIISAVIMCTVCSFGITIVLATFKSLVFVSIAFFLNFRTLEFFTITGAEWAFQRDDCTHDSSRNSASRFN